MSNSGVRQVDDDDGSRCRDGVCQVCRWGAGTTRWPSRSSQRARSAGWAGAASTPTCRRRAGTTSSDTPGAVGKEPSNHFVVFIKPISKIGEGSQFVGTFSFYVHSSIFLYYFALDFLCVRVVTNTLLLPLLAIETTKSHKRHWQSLVTLLTITKRTYGYTYLKLMERRVFHVINRYNRLVVMFQVSRVAR